MGRFVLLLWRIGQTIFQGLFFFFETKGIIAAILTDYFHSLFFASNNKNINTSTSSPFHRTLDFFFFFFCSNYLSFFGCCRRLTLRRTERAEVNLHESQGWSAQTRGALWKFPCCHLLAPAGDWSRFFPSSRKAAELNGGRGFTSVTNSHVWL